MKKLFIFLLVFPFFQSLAQVPSYIDTNGLLGWYPFSGNADNAYGTGKNGTVMGPTLTTDRFGATNSAYHFDGMYDHIVIDTYFFNTGWSNYTISLWMNNDSVDNPNNINNNQCGFNTIPHNGVGLGANWGHSGKYALYANSNPGVATWDILAGTKSHDSVVAHAWNHIVVSKQSDTLYSFYLNGSLDTSFVRHTPLAGNYWCKMLFGNIDSSRGNEGMWGSLDDYGIWIKTLSPCDVKRLFRTTSHLYITAPPADDTAAIASTAHFNITDTGAGNTYQWQRDTGTGFTNLTATSVYSGVTTPTLTVTGITSAMHTHRFRCVVTNPGGCADSSGAARLFVSSLSVYNMTRSPILITPNPTSEKITISGIDEVNVVLYNIIGQKIKENRNTNDLSVAELPSGTYIIRLFDRQGASVYTGKLIKQ